MSATTINFTTRDSLYTNYLKSLQAEGNKYLLYKYYLLGKGWNSDKIRFYHQYLNMISDFSCDVEALFNSKLKGLLELDTDTKISADAIEIQNAQYTMKIKKTDSVNMVEWFINTLEDCEEPEEVPPTTSNTVYVNDDDLLPYTGTLDEKITAYILSLGYLEEDINTTIWVDYIGDSPKP